MLTQLLQHALRPLPPSEVGSSARLRARHYRHYKAADAAKETVAAAKKAAKASLPTPTSPLPHHRYRYRPSPYHRLGRCPRLQIGDCPSVSSWWS